MARYQAHLLVATLGLAVAALGQAPKAPYTYMRAGNAHDVAVHTRPGYALMGGGTDLDEAFQWMCQLSENGDFLVLRASGTEAYNPYIQKLCPAENSVATLIIPDHAAAEDPFVAQTIAHAAAIFIAGGDQSSYVNFWTSTPVQAELNDAIRRGVPIGGTSAGLAVLGEFVYSAQGDKPHDPNLTSAVAMANPFQRQIVWTHTFVNIPALRGLITDTHFQARHREGRLLTFLARIRESGQASVIHGIGVDQHTALLVTPEGTGRVAGTGSVFFFTLDHAPEVCQAGKALTVEGVKVEKLSAGEVFHLGHWSGDGAAATISVRNGQLTPAN